MTLELLAPAKNLEYGREAVNHGADALYIGAPAFGARAAATNTIEDIDQLVRYAHLYGSKVFATVNTLLFDDEIESAVQMIYRLYDLGVDALIIQDMGLLECDLPPIELHASTQCHNATIERVKFMEQVGFKRVILARETSIEQMRAIRNDTTVDLEAFVHGALCVCYSGQCYMSQYLNSRSGNRGCCSQPCRSAYDLYDGSGRQLIKDRHLLSLKDFDASQQLGDMIDAGITSFKIEGRLKDLSYVKNVTAYYRQLLDSMMSGHTPASSGKSVFYFTPDMSRTFNRGYTDYFLRQRQPMASFDTQKALGKQVGTVSRIHTNTFTINTKETIVPGDGLCFLDERNILQGFLVNHVDRHEIMPNIMPDIRQGTILWRSHDHAFERQLQGNTANRKIVVDISFDSVPNGFVIRLIDEDGVAVEYCMDAVHEQANDNIRSSEQIKKQLAKLGDTPFVANMVTDCTQGRYFLPISVLNQMRRYAVELLIEHRISHFHPKDIHREASIDASVPEKLDYRYNIINKQAEKFYRNHGAREIEYGLESTGDYRDKALMTTKYCLRYELGCCLKGKSKNKPQVSINNADSLVLGNNGRYFRLEFDCSACQMRIYAKE
jgi:putative protease